MIGLALLVVGLVGQWLLGVVLADRLLGKRTGSSQGVATMSELAGLGFVLGVGLTAWCLFVWSFLGGRLGLLPSGLLTAIGYGLGIPLVKRLRKGKDSLASLLRSEQAVSTAGRTMVLLLIGWLVVQTLLTPQRLWDERAIFALKAKVLFEDRSIHSPTLLHPDFVQYHPRYPLLLPLAEEHIYSLLGHVDDRWSKVIFPLLYAGLVLTTAGVLLRNLTPAASWLGALLMATVPVMMPYEYGFLCGQADAPVACFHGVTVLYLWDAVRTIGRGESIWGSSVVAGICAGLTAFTKDEGIAYLMIDLAALGVLTLISVISPQRLMRNLGLLAVYLGGSVLILAPWFWHRRSLPLTTEMNYFGRMTPQLLMSRLDTLAWTVPHLWRRMFVEWREWGLQWWFMAVALIVRPLRATKPPQLLLLLDVIGSIASLIVAGMAAPAQLDEHIGGSSHRFLMQIAPVAVLFAVSQFFPRDSRTAVATSGSQSTAST